MTRLDLTFACSRYDRTEYLREGDVQVEGIDLNCLTMNSGREIFDRMVGGQEFDVAELSASEFICLMDQCDRSFVAIPVFPSRVFRHGYIFINRRSGITTPKGLEGRRVGVPLYTQTAAIWARGHLAHEFDVDVDSIRWMQGAVEKSGSHGKPSSPPLLRPVELKQNESGKSLDDLLAAGEIDALLGSRVPPALGRHPDVARLFPNYLMMERDFYRRTKIFPVMHLVAIRRALYEQNRWIANSLFRAFVESKRRAWRRLRYGGSLVTMLPWQLSAVDEVEQMFGGDPYPYGVEPNRPTLEALVKYMFEQHFISRVIPIEELFAPLPGVFDT